MQTAFCDYLTRNYLVRRRGSGAEISAGRLSASGVLKNTIGGDLHKRLICLLNITISLLAADSADAPRFETYIPRGKWQEEKRVYKSHETRCRIMMIGDIHDEARPFGL